MPTTPIEEQERWPILLATFRGRLPLARGEPPMADAAAAADIERDVCMLVSSDKNSSGKGEKEETLFLLFFLVVSFSFCFSIFGTAGLPPRPPPPQKKKKKNKSIVLVPRVLALGALVEHRRPLVGGPQLHGVKLQPPVPALHARLVDGRADPRRRVRRAARRLIVPSVTAPVFPDRVRPQGSELVPPAVVVDVCLADDGHGVEVCFFFFF